MQANIGEIVTFRNGGEWAAEFTGMVTAIIDAGRVLVGLREVRTDNILRIHDWCDLCDERCTRNDNGLLSVCENCRNAGE